uniref:protein ALP1-like n=1 Tax=Styela clava TaxID=7725 RepID=UPI00193A7E91|nr:protein ALP1-like [Styela clava]
MPLSKRKRLAIALYLANNTEQKQREHWVHPILKRRKELGEYHRLVQEMRLERTVAFRNQYRLDPGMFDDLRSLVAPYITKTTTNFREPISPEERLGITLRFLATGDSYTTIADSYRTSKSTVSGIVTETCEAIWTSLKKEYLSPPTVTKWKQIAEEYEKKWNFPHCIGSIDGKHIQIQAPVNSGSLYYNYKHTFSIVLMALVDANYNFVFVDVRAYGKQSDGSVFSHSALVKLMNEGALNLPDETTLTNSSKKAPYVIVGDEAFPLQKHLMRPYPGRNLPIDEKVFNYRLSRARRVVENAFGIMSAKWRVFRRPMGVSPQNAELVVKAACCLHNYVRRHTLIDAGEVDREDLEGNITRGSWRVQEDNSFLPLQRQGRRNSVAAAAVRDSFKNYFMVDGACPWQFQRVRRT